MANNVSTERQDKGQLSREDVNLFICHREEDEQVAAEIRGALMGCSGRLKVHIFEKAHGGENIEEWIRKNLEISEILLFLYNDPNANWSWCSLEIGMYNTIPTNVLHHVICIGAPSLPWPTTLQNIQNVRARSEEIVEKFLRPFFHTSVYYPGKEPLNPGIREDQLRGIAEKIVSLMIPKEVRPIYYSERFMLEIPDIEKAKMDGIPENARIQTNEEGSQIFDLAYKTFTWKDLIDRMPEGAQSSWTQEINNTVKAVANKRRVPVQTSTIRSVNEGDIFRPIIYRIDHVNNVPTNFYIFFVKELAPDSVAGPGQLGTAFKLLRFSNRYLYEVIRPALNEIDGIGENEEKRFFTKNSERIRAVEDDAERHDLFNQEQIADCFPDAQEEVNSLFAQWSNVRPALLEALNLGQKESLKAQLQETNKIYLKFLKLGTERYNTLVQSIELSTN